MKIHERAVVDPKSDLERTQKKGVKVVFGLMKLQKMSLKDLVMEAVCNDFGTWSIPWKR